MKLSDDLPTVMPFRITYICDGTERVEEFPKLENAVCFIQYLELDAEVTQWHFDVRLGSKK